MNIKILKKIICAVSLLASVYGNAQKDLSNYKYILVPKKFYFSSSEDQYQLNSLTKFLFNKYGFRAYFVDDDLPDDLKTDRCLALSSEVSKEKSGMFKTKVEIILKDCYGVTVMTSKVGESRLKKFDKAYSEALRDAFETFQNTDYNYVSAKDNIVEPLKIVNEEISEVSKEDIKKSLLEESESVSLADQKTKAVSEKKGNVELYYAQAIQNGFQLVDSEPKIVMILLNTATKDVFIVKDRNAVVFNKEGKWIYSENDGDSKKEKTLNIKF
jgi:hypothetical protein